MPRRWPVSSRRARWAIAIAALALIVLFASLQRIAAFYTDFLWFKSLGFSSVWAKTVTVQVGLGAVFTIVLFAVLWSNLVLADKLAPSPAPPSGDILVTRWQAIINGHSRWLRLGVAIFFALVGGISAHSEWGNWLLFSNSVPFTQTSAPWTSDPVNHLNVSFYVFKLPFLNWFIGWLFSAVVLTLLLSLLAHYLNGGVRPHSAVQRVSPRVKAHLSVLLAVLALVQGANYFLARLSVVLSTNYVVNGATYTDVHAVRPALILLIAISVIAAGLFLYNARQQGWLLPTVAVALWGLVWLLVANVYPAAVQNFVVKPSEYVKEAQYITQNINATRYAYGLNDVQQQNFVGDAGLNASQLAGTSGQAVANRQTLANVRLLDPQYLSQTITNQQGFRQYYSMSGPSLDRYDLPTGPRGSEVETQVLISARQLDPNGVSPSWVNTHLQYTHGYGAVVAPVGQSGVSSGGSPAYDLRDLPPTGQPSLNVQPRIYYDTSSSSGNGYVVAGSNQAELDYEAQNGTQRYSPGYTASGGVPAGGLLRRLAFAVSFGDYNMVLSGQITSTSKVLYFRNVTERLEKAAPFLSYDSDPYPVVTGGSLYWVEDAYTTTDNYPYSEQAFPTGTSRLSTSPGSLGGQAFNYVRNSVKAVVNAYTGKVWFFVMPNPDPVISTYENAFPGLFTPVSDADLDIPNITSHWRYPEDLFTVQTDMYGRYHQTNSQVFYANSQQWSVAQNSATGLVSPATTGAPLVPSTGVSTTFNPQPNVLPQYELTALPGQNPTQQRFVLVEPFVPASNGNKQDLTAFMTAPSDTNDYGQLTAYAIPSSEQVYSPNLVTSAVETNNNVSSEITLLDKSGSKVILGNVIMTPIGQSLLYIEPLYVVQASNSVGHLNDVAVVWDGKVFDAGNGVPSLDAALCKVTNPDGSQPFASYCTPGTTPPTTPPANNKPPKGHNTTTSTTTTSTTAPSSTRTTTVLPTNGATLAQDLAGAEKDFLYANAALHQGDLATYQQDIAAAEALVTAAADLADVGAPKPTTTLPGKSHGTGGTTPPNGTTTTTSTTLPRSGHSGSTVPQASTTT